MTRAVWRKYFNAAGVSGGKETKRMRPQRHTRKEFISILFVSNTGGKNREYHVSRPVFNLLRYVPLLILTAFLILAGMVYLDQKELSTLRTQLDPYKKQIEQLETEQKKLSAENTRLADENKQLKQKEEAAAAAETESQPEENPYQNAPDGYPYTGTGGILISAFSEQQPYMSINTHTEGEIVAAGDGTVLSVSSDDTYPLIVEVQHTDGYITRYASREAAQTQLEENTQVKTGDTLFVITVDNTQFDYQIIFEDEAIDPLMVIEAKG